MCVCGCVCGGTGPGVSCNVENPFSKLRWAIKLQEQRVLKLAEMEDVTCGEQTDIYCS